nr:hypothetical protein [uncultured Sulfurimonas sp.]
MKIKNLAILTILVLSIGSTSLVAQQKPFLIQGKLPHTTMWVKQNWDNKEVGFTIEQKAKLKVIREKTMSGIASLKSEIFPLEDSIVKAIANGAKPSSLEEDVEKLAELRAEATMLHLECIYDTKKVLSKKQLQMLE